MKKSTSIILLAFAGFALVVSLPGLVRYFTPLASDSSDVSDTSSEDTSSVEEEPRYELVEVERYEIYFPEYVGGAPVYGEFVVGAGGYFGDLSSHFYSVSEYLANYNVPIFNMSLFLYLDGPAQSIITSTYTFVEYAYGRYVISETQVADELVAFTYEPIYEYVLVE